MVLRPSRLVEVRVRIPSTPLTDASSGSVIWDSITSAEAPAIRCRDGDVRWVERRELSHPEEGESEHAKEHDGDRHHDRQDRTSDAEGVEGHDSGSSAATGSSSWTSRPGCSRTWSGGDDEVALAESAGDLDSFRYGCPSPPRAAEPCPSSKTKTFLPPSSGMTAIDGTASAFGSDRMTEIYIGEGSRERARHRGSGSVARIRSDRVAGSTLGSMA